MSDCPTVNHMIRIERDVTEEHDQLIVIQGPVSTSDLDIEIMIQLDGREEGISAWVTADEAEALGTGLLELARKVRDCMAAQKEQLP